MSALAAARKAPLELDLGLERLQRELEQLYRLEPAPSVADFVIEAPPDGSGRNEELLILEEDELYLAVVLDNQLIASFGQAPLDPGNLEAFCLVVEGISHFLYVIHRARQHQRISKLELELQAEVDKYVACLLLAQRHRSLPSDQLRRHLYDAYQLHDDLSIPEQQRYHRANYLARRYSRRLELRYLRRRRVPAMLIELRRFFRMAYCAKQELVQGSLA